MWIFRGVTCQEATTGTLRAADQRAWGINVFGSGFGDPTWWSVDEGKGVEFLGQKRTPGPYAMNGEHRESSYEEPPWWTSGEINRVFCRSEKSMFCKKVQKTAAKNSERKITKSKHDHFSGIAQVTARKARFFEWWCSFEVSSNFCGYLKRSEAQKT